MRKNKLLLNSSTSLLLQMFNIISALILPRLIIQGYGTEANGLISSITQFLSIVALSECGMTVVVQSSLYYVLAKNDEKGINEIISSARRFYIKIGVFLFFYVCSLCVLYPLVVYTKFDYFYVISMIVILSINTISQYLWGVTNRQLICADQRVYIVNVINIVIVVLNTVICIVLIHFKTEIHILKLISAIVFLLNPVFTSLYVKKYYHVNRNVCYDNEPIKQKWNGIAQHIAYYIFTSTDIMILSLLSTLKNVSIYAVYVLILNGLKQLSSNFESGVKPILGELDAKGDLTNLRNYFSVYEWLMYMISIFLFGCTTSLLVPFISIYTQNIFDANYIVPTFALVITIAYLIQNVDNSYNTLIQAVGHYKQTQGNYIIVAIMNLIISIALVPSLGLVGVAIGTLISSTYQLLWQGKYAYKVILSWTIKRYIQRLSTALLIFAVGFIVTFFININASDYLSWFVASIPIALTWLVIIIFICSILNKNEITMLIKMLVQKNNS